MPKERISYYAKRRAVGLCCHCPNLATGARCEDCRKKHKQRYKARCAKSCPNCDKPPEPGSVYCTVHKQYFRDRYTAWKQASLCADCGKPPVEGSAYCAKCREQRNRRNKVQHRNMRQAVLKAYGGDNPACACCGEPIQEFLEIDHIENNGAAHRREIGNGGRALYTWLKKNNFPTGFQVLCSNCNKAKHIYGRCPHKAVS